jgi:hypothetical protein
LLADFQTVSIHEVGIWVEGIVFGCSPPQCSRIFPDFVGGKIGWAATNEAVDGATDIRATKIQTPYNGIGMQFRDTEFFDDYIGGNSFQKIPCRLLSGTSAKAF